MLKRISSNLVDESPSSNRSGYSPQNPPENGDSSGHDESPDGDLTQEKQADIYQRLTENAPVGMFQIDPAGQLLFANQYWVKITGVSFQKAHENGWLSVIHPDDKARVRNEWNSSIWSEDEFNCRCRLDDPDETDHWVCIHIHPETDDTGEILSYIGSLTEIRADQEIHSPIIEQAAKTEAQADKFAQTLSQDLQDPMRMIISYLQLLGKRADDRLSPIEYSYVNFALEESKRMKAQLEGIHDYVQIRESLLETEMLDIRQLVDEALSTHTRKINDLHAEIIKDELPSIPGNKALIRRVFDIILDNAIKFRDTTKPLKIRIGSQPGPHFTVYYIIDNGIGIVPRYEQQVFEIFSRLHAQEDYPGLGLGLFLAKAIIEKHQGQIWCESAPGEGSTFYFSLPA